MMVDKKTEGVSERNAKLLAQAERLRAEALELETEQKLLVAESMYESFQFFDTDNSGSVDVTELREGLKKTVKLQLSEEEATRLMNAFDDNGDGVLQPSEFKSVEEFKRKFEEFVKREKEEANAARANARLQRKAAEEAERRAELVNDILNDGKPTPSDRAVSLLPYLFPLLDATQYGQDYLGQVPPNPVIITLEVFYKLYNNIPLSGIIAFFALNFLSQNLQLNRLVRFNIRQAIFIDIALIFPSLLSGIAAYALPEIGINLPTNFNSIFSSLVFLSFSAAILYSVSSSIFGIIPDKLPYISERVNSVLPTVNQLKEMLEEEERRKNMTPEERQKEMEEMTRKRVEKAEEKRKGDEVGEDDNDEPK